MPKVINNHTRLWILKSKHSLNRSPKAQVLPCQAGVSWMDVDSEQEIPDHGNLLTASVAANVTLMLG